MDSQNTLTSQHPLLNNLCNNTLKIKIDTENLDNNISKLGMF